MEETIVVSAISRENNVEIVSSVDLLPDLKILFMYEFNVWYHVYAFSMWKVSHYDDGWRQNETKWILIFHGW